MIDLDVVDIVAETLGETDPVPLATIRRIVRTIGPERTQAFVTQALEVEANGGMTVPDGSRRRTLGGVFFYLVKESLSDAEREAIFPPRKPKLKPKQQLKQQQQGGISPFWLCLANGGQLGDEWRAKDRAIRRQNVAPADLQVELAL